MKGVPDAAHRNNVQIFKCELPWNSHFHRESEEIQSRTRHLSLHIYGHVNNLPDHQELDLWDFDGVLLHNRNVRYSENGLNLGHWIRTSALRELVAADHRDVDTKNSLLRSLHCGHPLCAQLKCPVDELPVCTLDCWNLS